MRNVRLGKTAALALACALAAACTQQSPQGSSATPVVGACDDTHSCTTTKLALRDQMRALWTDHVAYTRFYLIEAIANLPQAKVTAARLLHNQDQIGDAIKPFYGEDAGNELSRLLREHIQGAVAVLDAAKSGNADALQKAKADWYANADDIAHFLAAANPAWSFDDLDAMMRVHLDQTIAEATARLTAHWDADVRTFDEIVAHILDMADVLADGIAKQFPDRVSCGDLTAADDLHLEMRALWEDHVIWTRIVIIEATARAVGCNATPFADLDVAIARLLRNQDDIGNAVRPLLGDAAADKLTTLLHAHITIAVEIVSAAVASDTRKLDDAVARWYANADDIAQLLASVLPVPLADVKAMMREHLDQTLAEATDQLAGRFEVAIADYDAIVAHILDMADALSSSIAQAKNL